MLECTISQHYPRDRAPSENDPLSPCLRPSVLDGSGGVSLGIWAHELHCQLLIFVPIVSVPNALHQ